MTQSIKENTLVKAKRLTRSSTVDTKKEASKKESKIEILEKVETPETPDLVKLRKKVVYQSFLYDNDKRPFRHWKMKKRHREKFWNSC